MKNKCYFIAILENFNQFSETWHKFDQICPFFSLPNGEDV
jgi:hypothetical protein